MKRAGFTKEAIQLANKSGGHHEALHFLLMNGLEAEAISQATNSRSIEGLLQLSKELMKTNPRLSILCFQGHLLSALEDREESMSCFEFRKIINNCIDIFNAYKMHINEPVAENKVEYVERSRQHVPHLSLLTKISSVHGNMYLLFHFRQRFHWFQSFCELQNQQLKCRACWKMKQ
jgi:hypothetical protein